MTFTIPVEWINAVPYFVAAFVGSFLGTLLGIFAGRTKKRTNDLVRMAMEAIAKRRGEAQADLSWQHVDEGGAVGTAFVRMDLKDPGVLDLIRRLDTKAFLKKFPPPDDLPEEKHYEFALLNMHVTRANAPMFTMFEAHASRKWLEEFEKTGTIGITVMPFPPPNGPPEGKPN